MIKENQTLFNQLNIVTDGEGCRVHFAAILLGLTGKIWLFAYEGSRKG